MIVWNKIKILIANVSFRYLYLPHIIIPTNIFFGKVFQIFKTIFQNFERAIWIKWNYMHGA